MPLSQNIVVKECPDLCAEDFLELAQRVWPGKYDRQLSHEALRQTINITAWVGPRLIGVVRVLSDGYFFGTIPEILVDPSCQRQGVGRQLMDMAWELSPTSIFLGAQPGKEGFFEKLGYGKGMTAYTRLKPRRKAQ